MTDYDPTPLSVALGFLAFAVLVATLLVIGVLIRHLLTRNAHPALVPPDGRGVVPIACSVALCETRPSVRVYASGEWWEFCVDHGLPYLTEGLREKAS